MIETIISMIAILIAFLALFNLSDLMRTRLLVENASAKCARARAVGYNDFMLRKIARLSTMPAAGKCLTASSTGDGALTRSERYSRIGEYLSSEYEAEADAILDFELWQNGRTATLSHTDSINVSATVAQRRPQPFSIASLTGLKDCADCGDETGHTDISASSSTEAHYPDYLQ